MSWIFEPKKFILNKHSEDIKELLKINKYSEKGVPWYKTNSCFLVIHKYHVGLVER